MKPPTKKELQALAVRALGEGATVEISGPYRTQWMSQRSAAHYASAAHHGPSEEVSVWHRKRSMAKRALAAALTALAEVNP